MYSFTNSLRVPWACFGSNPSAEVIQPGLNLGMISYVEGHRQTQNKDKNNINNGHDIMFLCTHNMSGAPPLKWWSLWNELVTHVPYLPPSAGTLLTQQVLNGTASSSVVRPNWWSITTSSNLTHTHAHTHPQHHSNYMHNNRAENTKKETTHKCIYITFRWYFFNRYFTTYPVLGKVGYK